MFSRDALHGVYIHTYLYINIDMPLSIKNSATERLARQVASATGESLTEAIHKALEERWRQLKAKRRSRVLDSQLEDVYLRVLCG
jgi:hypothetical protein